MTKASLGAGDVEIELDGERVKLRPSLKASQIISRESGGVVGAIERAARFDHDTIVSCVALGLGKTVKEIEEAAWQTGLATLAPPVMEFLSMIANGGRPRSGGSESPKGE